MKHLLILLICIAGYGNISAQDTFQSELFPVETVLKYRSELELSEAQVSTIKKIYNDNISLFNATKWDLDAMQVALNKLISESKVDEKTALETMDKISAMEQKLKSQRLKMLIKIKNELTTSQQSKLKELRKDSDISTFKLTTPISENPRIVLRGSASKDGKSPMYVIIDKNGEKKFVNGEAQKGLLGISPDNIESVNVIKGKAATTTYGKDGENGVVVIKLKQ
ncbi:TonB-dependent receptor plug domain-containing protein [uncultured Dokdonia sp.]|uniref:Spy/CpxP family protein refolding chaperone n=1 Tax=uncultured Dokdonia sp. TaxID=575653 RepID=UPI00261D85E4|nr:TonB-dependent receptor plug domain-containing protein [uncultured Dokdonia sp.]